MIGLTVINETPVSDATLAGYREANLCLPLSSMPEVRSSKLAIVGSGPSLRQHFQELADFDGEIWAINGAWGWLHSHGVEATFFSIDPLPIVAAFSQGAKKVILASQCDPAVFGARMHDGARVTRITREALGGFSAVGASVFARDVGFKEVSLFGCECSFKPEQVHVDGRQLDEVFFIIGVGEDEFLTRMPYYQQALGLSAIIAEYPGLFHERSGGLLGALVGCFDQAGIPPEMPWVVNTPLDQSQSPLSLETLNVG